MRLVRETEGKAPAELTVVEEIPESYAAVGMKLGCTREQMGNFWRANIALQPRQLCGSAAARMCDDPEGPTQVGFGGARGGGKSFWMLAQMGADDCQRLPGLKCLLLRKVGKSNVENFEDLQKAVFKNMVFDYSSSRGLVTFPNGSRILTGHFQYESDIDSYLGLEYDIIGVEEATTLTQRKYSDITTCCRSSKIFADGPQAGRHWRPRLYSTTNPGGVGHTWYRDRFVVPFQYGRESDTRYVRALATDNRFNNPEYLKTLEGLSGWQKRAWCDSDWDIQAGQYFANFRRDAHVISEFNPKRASKWVAALDYGYNHYTVCLLGCLDHDGRVYVVDEHAARGWLIDRQAEAIKAMLARNNVQMWLPREHPPRIMYSDRPLPHFIRRIHAGPDVQARESSGRSIADEFMAHGLRLCAMHGRRVQGWRAIMARLGDPEREIKPRLFIHERCKRLIECMPSLQNDPSDPEDVLKFNIDESGHGGDDAADALRYLLAEPPVTVQKKLVGW